jgi:hypothetical protein
MTGRPLRRESVSDAKTGVTRASAPIRERAAAMSASVGPVRIAIRAHFEHLLEDLADRCQWIELAPLDFAEEPLELWIVRHGLLEVALRPCTGDRKDLAGEVLCAALG